MNFASTDFLENIIQGTKLLSLERGTYLRFDEAYVIVSQADGLALRVNKGKWGITSFNRKNDLRLIFLKPKPLARTQNLLAIDCMSESCQASK
jgi:hypothetical protein